VAGLAGGAVHVARRDRFAVHPLARHAAYGFNPMPVSDADERREHGIDEHPTQSLRTGVELLIACREARRHVARGS
jgi:hypothetical protein